MIRLFTITLLVSSGLLFLVQPMFARIVLPLLGGTPAVWNTCMVFFQASLLAGYLYAHLSTKWLGVRRQTMLHAGVLLLPMLVLPIGISEGWAPPSEGDPIGWLLLLLTATIGLPFFVVAASAPLMQKWFSSLGHETSDDPYYLYAASNAGSMTALLAYPTIFEPLMTLSQQSAVWTGGYVLLALLTIGCAVAVVRHHKLHHTTARGHATPTVEHSHALPPLLFMRKLRWIALTAVPSSLLLGVTQYITTDLVVVPVLWVIPLAMYLLTFILVFARRRLIPQHVARRALPPAALVLLLMLVIEATNPLVLIVVGHLLAFFILALACHGELADDRPSTRDLTSYYLMMGIGGMLGGVFNAIIAPHLFTTVAEYPIAVAAAALFMVRPGELWNMQRSVWIHLGLPVLLGAITLGMIALANTLELGISPLRLLLTAGLPALGCYVLSQHPLRFGLALAAVFFAASFDTITRGHILEAHRGFFGVHRVALADGFHRLFHGTTLHGTQRVDENGRPHDPDTPLAYYHREGPIGQVFAAQHGAGRTNNVGLVGLGVGALAAYGQPGQRFAFFEIDPLVQRIAEDQRYFTFLSDARHRGVDVPIVLGDARLTLELVEPGTFDLLVIDAFSSDSIPVHLLTREAIAIYRHVIHDDGIIAMHISNRYLNLQPVVANLAASLGMVCAIRDDSYITAEHAAQTGREGSVWAVLAPSMEQLGPLSRVGSAQWIIAPGDPDAAVWTDEYSNVLGALAW